MTCADHVLSPRAGEAPCLSTPAAVDAPAMCGCCRLGRPLAISRGNWPGMGVNVVAADTARPSTTQVRSGGVHMDHEKTEKTMMEVTIFGLTLKIRGDADPELTLKLAEFVDHKMHEAVPSTMRWTNVLYHERLARVAILAALNIAEELFQL